MELDKVLLKKVAEAKTRFLEARTELKKLESELNDHLFEVYTKEYVGNYFIDLDNDCYIKVIDLKKIENKKSDYPTVQYNLLIIDLEDSLNPKISRVTKYYITDLFALKQISKEEFNIAYLKVNNYFDSSKDTN